MKEQWVLTELLLSLLVLLIVHGGARAATIYVPDDHDTVQVAIDNAADGDTIIVRDETYTEYVELGTSAANTKNNLIIQAENEGSAIIQCTDSGAVPVIYIEGDSEEVPTGITIDGFDIRRSNGGKGAGVFISNANTSTYAAVTVENCTISGDTTLHSGVRLNGYIEATITGNTITGPKDAGIATSAPDYSSSEDYLYGASIVTIEDNIINGNSVTAQAGIFLKGHADNTAQVVIRGTGSGEPKASRIHGNGTAGIRLEDIYGAVTIDNNQVNNNSKAGICMIDINSGEAGATIQNNDIYDNTQAGITVAGASHLTIGSNNNINDNGTGGVAFNKATITVLYSDPINVSSEPVTISGNNIYSNNTYAGIGIIDAITGTVTIADQNDIYQNTRGGIGIQNSCELHIIGNKIRDNVRGGIHTGADIADDAFSDGTGFMGGPGSADLTIGQNKVYGNGESGYGAGIDVRHASGTIYNNLVYRNHRGGIRFGDYITEIVNNTVAHNGNDNDTPTDPDDDRGGGIIYDNLAGAVNAEPEGTLSDSDNYPNPRIRNNISASNITSGLRVGRMPTEATTCPDNPVYSSDSINYRDYNLVYLNNGTTDDCGWYTDTGISYALILSCANKQYGGCGADWPYPFAMGDPHDIIADPLFVSTTEGSEDYHLQAGSPAVGGGVGGSTMGAYGGSYPIDW